MNQPSNVTPTMAAPLVLELLDLKAVHHPELEHVTAFARSHDLSAAPLVYQRAFVCNFTPSERDQRHATLPYPVPANICLSTLLTKAADSGRVSGVINADYASLDIGYYDVSDYAKLPETQSAMAQHAAHWKQANLKARPARIFTAVFSLLVMCVALAIGSTVAARDSVPSGVWLTLLEIVRRDALIQFLLYAVLVTAFTCAVGALTMACTYWRRANEFHTVFTYHVRLSGFVPNRWRAIIASANQEFEPRGVELITPTVYNPLTQHFDLAGSSAQVYLRLEHGSYTLGSFDFEPIDSGAPLERDSPPPIQP